MSIRLDGISFWKFKTKYVGQLRLCECDASADGKWFYLSKVLPNSVCGGDYSLELTVDCGGKAGKSQKSVRIGRITGQDPIETVVRTKIAALAEAEGYKNDVDTLNRIACHESKFHQFDGEGMPVAGYPHDFGIFQISSPEDKVLHCRTAWDWELNLHQGVSIFISKKRAANEYGAAEKGFVIKKTEEGNSIKSPRNSDLLKCIKTFLASELVGLTAQEKEKKFRDFPLTPLSPEEKTFQAIKGYNGGREYTYIPLNGDIFLPQNKCAGKWAYITLNDAYERIPSEYLSGIISINPETCVKAK